MEPQTETALKKKEKVEGATRQQHEKHKEGAPEVSVKNQRAKPISS